MGDLEDLSSLANYRPDPSLRDGDKLLIAMSKNKATDLRVFCGKRLGFRIAGRWHDVGSRDLRETDVRGCLVGILAEEQIERVLAGNDIQVSHCVPGHGDFFVRVFLRDGALGISAVNA